MKEGVSTTQSHVYEQRKITACKVSWQQLLVIVYNGSLVDANTASKHTIQMHLFIKQIGLTTVSCSDYKDECLNYDTAFSIAFDKLNPKRSHPLKCLAMQVYAESEYELNTIHTHRHNLISKWEASSL